MIRLSRIIRDYEQSNALQALVNVAAALDDQVFVTKSGDLLMFLQIRGMDYECKDASQLDAFARRFEAALRALDENTRLYQYVLKCDGPAIPHAPYEDPVVQQAVSGRAAYLQEHAHGLYSLDTFFVVAYEDPASAGGLGARLAKFLRAPVATLRESLSSAEKTAAFGRELERRRELLTHKVANFAAQLPDEIRAQILPKQGAFTLLRRLLNYAPHKSAGVRLKYDDFADYQACGSSLECFRDHLRLDDYHVTVLTLKEPPSQTFAHVLKGLQEIPSNMILTSEWKRESPGRMLRRIHSKRRHFYNSKSSWMSQLSSGPQTRSEDLLVDDAAVAHIGDLGSCLREIQVQGRAFGEFSMTVILFDKDPAQLKRSVAECFKVFAAQDAQLTEERYNLLNAWLAVLPGNRAHNLRRFWLLDTNCADLSFLFSAHTGEVRNTHLGGAEYLAVLETNQGTPYFWNLHCGDIAHTIIFGGTGSGKSFLGNFLLTHAQKYRPITYLFDLGGSYESLTQLFGGTYLPVGVEQRGFTINPFSLPPTKENLHFLFSFVRVLIESGAGPINAADEHDLYEQIENLYVVEPEQRRLFTLSNMLGRSLRAGLQKWVEGGPYASLFDNLADNLTFARFQTFDFEGMQKVPQVLEPLLFYVLHRANAAIYDPAQATTLKLFVMDEAWRFLRHPTIRQYILEALKTWRKKNAAMILATQSSDDLVRSEMLSAVVESCATKMFLANPDADLQAYRDVFHLNETEAGLIARLIPKKQILIKRPEMAKVVNLNVGEKDYWIYTSNPYDRERRREAFERYGFEQGLDILARTGRSRSPSS